MVTASYSELEFVPNLEFYTSASSCSQMSDKCILMLAAFEDDKLFQTFGDEAAVHAKNCRHNICKKNRKIHFGSSGNVYGFGLVPSYNLLTEENLESFGQYVCRDTIHASESTNFLFPQLVAEQDKALTSLTKYYSSLREVITAPLTALKDAADEIYEKYDYKMSLEYVGRNSYVDGMATDLDGNLTNTRDLNDNLSLVPELIARGSVFF